MVTQECLTQECSKSHFTKTKIAVLKLGWNLHTHVHDLPFQAAIWVVLSSTHLIGVHVYVLGQRPMSLATLTNFCVNLMIWFFYPGSSLAATQRLQELSHISSTAGQRHLTGKGDASHALLLNANHQGQIELPQRGKEELTSAAAHSTGGFLQEGAQKRQYYPWMIEQTTLYPGKQTVYNLYVSNTNCWPVRCNCCIL